MCNGNVQVKLDKITKDIEKQGGIVSCIVKRMGDRDMIESNKLGMTDEWRSFENTAMVKKFVDEEITLLDLRIKRMEMKANGYMEDKLDI